MCKKWKIQPSFITIQSGILIKDISTYCEGRDQFLVLSVLNPDRDVPRILKQFNWVDLLRFQIHSDATSISSIWSLDTDLAEYCGTLSIPSLTNRCFTFQYFYDSIEIHQYRVVSIDLGSRYICPHPSKLICSNIAAVLQFLSASSLKEMFYLRQYLSTYFPQEQSYSISSRISPCVYLGSHLLLTSCSTNPRIYTHLNLRQGFKIPISGLFCYKWTVTELYGDKEIERDQFKTVISKVTILIKIIHTWQ